MNNRVVGAIKEDMAIEYMEKNGFTILERNYKCKIGEIDIIAKKDNIIRFVEVKYRKDQQYGGAFYAINNKKLEKIYKVASFYVMVNKLENEFFCFDAVLINGDKIQYIDNIYQNM